MENLLVTATKCTPKVDFKSNGELFLRGRSLPEDPFTFYNPLLMWISNFEGSNITLDIKLEYMNTASSKQIYTLLCNIVENKKIQSTLVNWHYEEGDEDGLETGKEFQEMTKLSFQFYEYAEVAD